MGERRENLKKALGIPEYPWSSDDDEPEVSASQPTTSTATMNLPLWARPAPISQPSTTTTTSNSVPVIVPSSSTSSSRPNPTRLERNMFWSLLCSDPSKRQEILSRSRTSSEAQRREAILASCRVRNAVIKRTNKNLREIRNMLSIKKPTPSTSHHHRSHSLHYVYGLRNGNSQPTLRGPTLFNPGMPLATPTVNSRNEPSSSSRHSDPQPSTSSGSTHRRPPNEVIRITYHSNAEPETNQNPKRNDPDVSAGSSSANDSQNVSTEMSLEEEVVEVEPAAEVSEEHNNTTADDSVVVENQSGPADASTPENESSRSDKKKKESKEESFNELNQSLLRLLECPVCLDWMEPPMSQCRRGHLVCVKCRARLSSCPVCRTTFSSVRNRAMEEVAEVLRYPCRHGCARAVRLRRRAAHEASCSRRRYPCPAPACAARPHLPRTMLAHHAQTKHPEMLKNGRKHKFSVKVNAEQHDNWIITALEELFHLRIDVDIRTWGITIYVAYIGPKNLSKKYNYEVTVVGKHNSRKIVYTRGTHSDLESASVNVSRRDCFHLSLDQALNFLRIKNRHCESDNSLNVCVTISRNENEEEKEDSQDS